MKTTLETDNETLSYVKLYCDVKHIPQKDFLKHILKENKGFMKFVKSVKGLKV